MKYKIEEINSIAKDMRYEALYWALGFVEYSKGIFTKEYNDGLVGKIDAEKQLACFSKVNIKLISHQSFVVLECVDKLLKMGYPIKDISLISDIQIRVNNLLIDCYEWNYLEDKNGSFKDYFISYSSRLVSGVIERKYLINHKYEYGIFENDNKSNKYELYNSSNIKSNDFEIKGLAATKVLNPKRKMIVPNGIKELGTCLFWDNQIIEEIVLPESLVNIGGDTFYNCYNLKKIIIPKNVKFMGNNPFAGCPKIQVINKSDNFVFKDNALYTKDYFRMIYYSISSSSKVFMINENTKIVGKHCFYKCNNLKKVIIPKGLIKLENNPFSGCEQLNLVNNSTYYHIVDKVIYDKEKKSIIGCLNSIKTDELKLLNVTRICRNSFWNCKGIKKIVFPKTLKTIGYNPFVACKNIEFKSLSKDFIVKNGVLFNKDMSRIICYPNKIAIGEIHIPDSVTTLERGAFSGCDRMTSVNLHNVSIISKTCFTNCDSLKKVYCSDLVSYIGEWAFAHCKQLKEISILKDCFLERNIVLNSPTKIIKRGTRSNYLIESENLYSLKSMLNGYTNKIDSILIDPPYNSNIDYIEYKDAKFKGSYYNFLKERLNISKELLTDNGYLVINIDEGEYKNVHSLCKELFKFVDIYKWEKLHDFFDKNRDVRPYKKRILYEYIIIASKSKFNFNKIKQPYIKNNKLIEKWNGVPKTFSCFGTTSSAKDELAKIFGKRDAFSTPKPTKLIKELIRATTKRDSIILDYFAGSGTTGIACDNLNDEDKGKRHYILITNSESSICMKITKIRLFKSNSKFVLIN